MHQVRVTGGKNLIYFINSRISELPKKAQQPQCHRGAIHSRLLLPVLAPLYKDLFLPLLPALFALLPLSATLRRRGLRCSG